MVAIYYILALISWLIGAIFLLPLSLKKKYRSAIPARFFLFNNPKFKDAKVHFHACSYGEIQALTPIMRKFEDKAISVVTHTGFEAAKKISQNSRFLPFEIFLPFWLKKSKILVIFEAELWLMLVFVAKLNGSRVILINARISDRSYARYKKFSFFYATIFRYIDQVYAQSDLDKERLMSLGAKDIKVAGNVKSAFASQPGKIYKKPKERVIVLASTHEGEEKMLLENLKLSKNDKLVIAPRHPERFASVGEFVKEWSHKHGFEFDKFSQNGNFNRQITLLDTLGELVNVYAISDVVVLGGSFVSGIGGHNPIECANFNPILVSGEHVFNQKALFRLVSGVKFIKTNELNDVLSLYKERARIINKADITAIIDDIRSSYEQ
ncbi:lipid IV(A) 3-deoxy-D-manno-octulosonic acid transferase [Campylobacter sp. RM13119]|uniref:lipid IV(A) 3-deoxy-D-manno-octulosonic acid transferase n=1 Tax=Campylobacter TaxID=194 RepID=UPI001475D483|nr:MULTISPECIES: lipid IV(A) 3-deoxy-D-manno-octulosonic acid transferase [unclassified Campylobacter]MBE3022505.1 lipid IV(A) 3-deoxy-D-manno-octulosonic acid transferase [Campylobacter sp. 7477a]MBE3606257.1 lipid IV(A) 3-deoxy-D-manno-octulosonic acid transferase [Campylobacter sp. RM13119]MBE3608933.1 lipid IV(A) 3-deoxy-D-manno-octulosonic acid transferase [Campylobacter sp. RM12916]